MRITADNPSSPLQLYAYNQLFDFERQQLGHRPADEKEPRYFVHKESIVDSKEFTEQDGLWLKKPQSTIMIQFVPPTAVLISTHGSGKSSIG